MVLFQLVRKICNGSASTAVDDMACTAVELLYSFLLLCGKTYDFLPKCMKSSEDWCSALKENGFRFSTDGVRDGCMSEFISRNQQHAAVHTQ